MFIQTTVFTASSLLGIANSFWPGNPMQEFITGHAEHLFLLVIPDRSSRSAVNRRPPIDDLLRIAIMAASLSSHEEDLLPGAGK
jgi:hypothetical protein